MVKAWINIEDYIQIFNEVIDAELDAIDNQDEDVLFCMDDASEDENDSLIVPEEENNQTKMQIMDCLDKIQSYLKK